MRGLVFPLVSMLLTGCATSSVVPFAQDTVQVSVEGSGMWCGRGGVEKIAIARAAAETIKNGYDDFAIVDEQYDEPIKFAGTSPKEYRTVYVPDPSGTGPGTVETEEVGGGDPIFEAQSQKSMVVKMFKAGDKAAGKIQGGRVRSAREVLGPDWRKRVAGDLDLCVD